MTQQERDQAQAEVSHRISRVFLTLIGVLTALVAVAYIAMPAKHSTAGHMMAAVPAAPAQMVTVAMHDPGCHWFQAGQGFQKSLSVTGPVSLLNIDEAALRVAGPAGTQTANVGQTVSLTPGKYRITMVDQASDDNTLHLSVSS